MKCSWFSLTDRAVSNSMFAPNFVRWVGPACFLGDSRTNMSRCVPASYKHATLLVSLIECRKIAGKPNLLSKFCAVYGGHHFFVLVRLARIVSDRTIPEFRL